MYFKQQGTSKLFVLKTGNVEIDKQLPLFDFEINPDATSIKNDSAEFILKSINTLLSYMNRKTQQIYLDAIKAMDSNTKIRYINTIKLQSLLDNYLLFNGITELDEEELQCVQEQLVLNLLYPVFYQHRVPEYTNVH